MLCHDPGRIKEKTAMDKSNVNYPHKNTPGRLPGGKYKTPTYGGGMKSGGNRVHTNYPSQSGKRWSTGTTSGGGIKPKK